MHYEITVQEKVLLTSFTVIRQKQTQKFNYRLRERINSLAQPLSLSYKFFFKFCCFFSKVLTYHNQYNDLSLITLEAQYCANTLSISLFVYRSLACTAAQIIIMINTDKKLLFYLTLLNTMQLHSLHSDFILCVSQIIIIKLQVINI